MLQGLCRASSLPVARQQCRSFHISPIVESYRARKGMTTTIRVPSKRAKAAKEKRKAAVLSRKDATTKLTPASAINVLKAISASAHSDTISLFVRAKLGSGIAVPKGRYKFAREAKTQTKDTILVFAEGRQAEEAKRAGANIVGGIELIEPVASGRLNASTILCSPALIRAITPRLGRVLGPKGLMPSERRGTVTEDFSGFIRNLVGTSEWKADKQGAIRVPFAKSDWPREDISRNFETLMQSIKQATGNTKTKDSVGSHAAALAKVIINTTRGPGIRLIEY